MRNPTPEEIKAVRTESELSRRQFSELVYETPRKVQDWELGTAKMHPGLWDLARYRIQESLLSRQLEERSRLADIFSDLPGSWKRTEKENSVIDQVIKKHEARVLVGHAVRTGQLLKPDACSKCGSGEKIEGHHEDYSDPLDVIWLCRVCHLEHHADER